MFMLLIFLRPSTFGLFNAETSTSCVDMHQIGARNDRSHSDYLSS
jgi:hypothetical protein